jgi:hypothetical protein
MKRFLEWIGLKEKLHEGAAGQRETHHLFWIFLTNSLSQRDLAV